MTNKFDIRDFFSEDDVEGRLEIQQAVDGLCVREKRILYLYISGHTQEQIAEIMGLTQQRISQVLAKISKQNG